MQKLKFKVNIISMSHTEVHCLLRKPGRLALDEDMYVFEIIGIVKNRDSCMDDTVAFRH